jgi:polyhydroxyalkanoate synthase
VKPAAAPRHWGPPDRETLPGPGFDRAVNAAAARYTGGISPWSIWAAYADWLVHLAASPGKQAQLAAKALRKLNRLALYAGACGFGGQAAEPCITPLPQDRRFRDAAWQRFPHNLIYQAFLLAQQWWHNAATGVRGVTPHHEHIVDFLTRQWLDVFSPSNYVATNPEVWARTAATGGMNLARGFTNALEDLERYAAGRADAGGERYAPGKTVALTPGKVVYRNALLELIQYAPATAEVRPEPVLVVPSWIMKYYILDLSPHNSLVRHLVAQGHTVFMVSWRNPGAEDRALGLDDYLAAIRGALEACGAIVPQARVHLAGYCIGGTMAAVTAALAAREEPPRLASLTLFAAELDFEEPGELSLFVDESQIAMLEDVMEDQGYLDGKQLAGAFLMLNSRDLLWSKRTRNYLLGERDVPSDLMAWNADATRLPARMHSEFLRKFYLDNDLAEGRFRALGSPVALRDIGVPAFVVATEWDHISPWRSVYKAHLLMDTELTFLLTNGGHNAGIVSEPGRTDRHYRVATRKPRTPYVGPDEWFEAAAVQEGSWWPAWQAWLADRSGAPAAPPLMGNAERGLPPLADAPGRYVTLP